MPTPTTIADRLLPDGVVWLDPQGLPHPEAMTGQPLPFVFLAGRVDGHPIREAALIVEAMGSDDGDILLPAFDRYARYVVQTVPTVHARLNGRVCAAWQIAEART
jgi:hypothetical protein